jgi:hypothetical protein
MSWLTLGSNTMMPNVIKAGTGIANAAKNGTGTAPTINPNQQTVNSSSIWMITA